MIKVFGVLLGSVRIQGRWLYTVHDIGALSHRNFLCSPASNLHPRLQVPHLVRLSLSLGRRVNVARQIGRVEMSVPHYDPRAQ